MRITGTMVTNNLVAELQNLDSEQNQLQTEVSSGLAVTQPSDNPAAYGQTIELEGQSSQIAEYEQNAASALNTAGASYSGLSALQSIFDTASQIGTEGTGANNVNDSQDYATELGQLIQQAVTAANTEIGGQYLFGGTAASTPPFTTTTDASGNVTAVNYVGNSDSAQVQIAANATLAPGTSGATNQGIAAIINSMIALQSALNTGSDAAVATASTQLGTLEGTLTDAVAENGAIQARIQSSQTQQQAESTALNTQISNDTAANLPTTIVNLNQAQLAYQAALQTSASVMHLSILNYIELE